MSRSNVYRDGRVHVLSEQCATCIFRPGNLMHLQPGRLRGMMDATRDEGCIPCHCTLGGDEAICRGWYDRADTIAMRLARATGVICEVPPPAKNLPD